MTDDAARELAEAKARIEALEAELDGERRADAEIQETIGKYMADAERLEAENARLRESARVAQRALEHDTCWADGQPANSSIDALVEGLVVCPACRAIKIINAALSPAPPADALAEGYRTNAEQARAGCAEWDGTERREAPKAQWGEGTRAAVEDAIDASKEHLHKWGEKS